MVFQLLEFDPYIFAKDVAKNKIGGWQPGSAAILMPLPNPKGKRKMSNTYVGHGVVRIRSGIGFEFDHFMREMKRKRLKKGRLRRLK